ncbi:pilus assembly protein PilV [Aquincola sp. S2]|uniref:Pilus assembly protein PilV n=1 Tax=Pseudaquabacterium terrae TaxID=2732868 RepID=A0ABX2EB84_9BURK|nr:pilus assembly protein PilV [Aquabacterium terrae]NRF66143.1 pilus assembly protein PilV [Aquabacterium terrae]
MKRALRSQRGFGLFDGLVALSLLGFGMLALVRMETRMAGNANEATQRQTASLLTDELLIAMLVDNGNANCYTLPAAGGCGNATARASTDAWAARALATLPHATSATSTINAATSRITVRLTWYYKESAETRMHEVSSDIR